MKVKILFSSVLIILLFSYSCEKDEFKPVTFQKNRFENKNVRFFQIDGEVFDVDKISIAKKAYEDDFSMLSSSFKFALDSNIIKYNETNFSIEFTSFSKALFHYDNGKVEEYIVSRHNDEIYFIKDSIVSTWLFDAYYNKIFCKFRPNVIKTESEPNTTSPTTYYKPTIFAYEINGEIQIPVLSYFTTYNNNRLTTTPNYVTYRTRGSSREQNSINDDFLSSITQGQFPREEIIFRESRIVFSKI